MGIRFGRGFGGFTKRILGAEEVGVEGAEVVVGFGFGEGVFGSGGSGGEDFAGFGDAGEVLGVEFDSGAAFGLEFAEFGERAAEDVVGVGAGAVDGFLGFGDGGFVGETVGGFDEPAAPETPSGAEDFFHERCFEDAGGGEFALQGGAGFGVFGLFVGTDEVVGGEEAVFQGVLGGRGLHIGSWGQGITRIWGGLGSDWGCC